MRSLCQWMLGVILLSAGCSGAGGGDGPQGVPGTATLRTAQVGHLNAPQARDFLASHSDAWVLDVRAPEEASGDPGIEGSRPIPIGELEGRMGEIEGMKDRPVVVVCQAGVRSLAAARMLTGAGFREVYNLDGGLMAWRQTEAIGR